MQLGADLRLSLSLVLAFFSGSNLNAFVYFRF